MITPPNHKIFTQICRFFDSKELRINRHLRKHVPEWYDQIADNYNPPGSAFAEVRDIIAWEIFYEIENKNKALRWDFVI